MRIVFPDGAACVQRPEDLRPLEQLGTTEFHEALPETRQSSSGDSATRTSCSSTIP